MIPHNENKYKNDNNKKIKKKVRGTAINLILWLKLKLEIFPMHTQ